MDNKKVRSTSSQVMELQQLIAGPLIATIEADSLSSQRYLDYLMKIAFESYDPVTGRTVRYVCYVQLSESGCRWGKNAKCKYTDTDIGTSATVASTGSRFRFRY